MVSLRILSAILLFSCTAGPTCAQFAAVEPLAGLNGGTGSRFDGLTAEAATGAKVMSVGDVNDDGFDDFLVSAPFAKLGGDQSAGAVYVVFGRGKPFPPSYRLSGLDGRNGFRIGGQRENEFLGSSASSAGDLNGDGLDDIAIASPNRDCGNQRQCGQVIVIFGRRKFPKSLSAADLDGKNGFLVRGQPGELLGGGLAKGGRLRSGSSSALLIGAPGFSGEGKSKNGAVYVLYARNAKFPRRIDLSNPDGSRVARIEGDVNLGSLGAYLGGAGDFNGDGYHDIVIGQPEVASATADSGGRVFVVFGSADGLPPTLATNTLDGDTGFSIEGSQDGQRVGYSVGFAGDFDGDGVDDLVVGSPYFDQPSMPDAGAAYLIYGGAGLDAVNRLSDLGATGRARRFDGTEANARTGESAAGAGDVNGDGYADMLIGAPKGGPEGKSEIGYTYLVFGDSGLSPGLNLSTLDGATGLRFEGVTQADLSATAVAGAGDANRDGFADILIGAINADPGGKMSAGSAYLVRGRKPVAADVRVGSDADQHILGGSNDDEIYGEGGDDVLEGGGGGDLLNGGSGGNTASYEHAFRGVTASLATPAGNIGDAAGDTYVGIVGLRGSLHNDRLIGDGGPNGIAGLKGRDVMTGGGGITTYFYYDVRESRPGDRQRDVITDFNPGTASSTVDRISLYTLDAKRNVNGHQYFKFIGRKGFSKRAGELRATRVGRRVLVQADVTGDGKADFEIHLKNLKSLRSLDVGDFILKPPV